MTEESTHRISLKNLLLISIDYRFNDLNILGCYNILFIFRVRVVIVVIILAIFDKVSLKSSTCQAI